LENGNITQASEFTENLRIRLVSYLGGYNLAIGYYPFWVSNGVVGGGGAPYAFLVAPSGNGEQLFRVRDVDAASGTFSLCLDYAPNKRLFWNAGQQVNLDDAAYGYQSSGGNYDDRFRVEFCKDGQWFILHAGTQPYVVDVDHGNTEIGDLPKILYWSPNGGDNQVWRAEVA
jgi:hypothetical protein